ncbi:MSHA biogenesis protein MshI [Shewanella cyperi]|uniref:MSHA biogenesis protein MshI n=1 Tax=Shewanella cyperi TaxID=2814292 RepID=UPI001D1904E7|nr:MSHA biogenesis protein MshI [Shewanella cyperi]
MENSFLARLSFWKANQSKRPAGLFLGESYAWVFLPQPGKDPEVLQFPIDDKDWSALMAPLSQRLGPLSLALVLCPARYQLLTVDKPAVPEDEVSQALVWSIKDMVSEPLDKLQIDYFSPPVAASNKLTVVCSAKPELQALVKAADDVGCELMGISIEELVSSRLWGKDSPARLVVSHVPEQDLLLTVVREGELWMQRRVRGFRELNGLSEQDLTYGVADNLSLEIQRSMDYFESQLRQAPVASIEVLVEGSGRALSRLLAANFNQKVNYLETDSVAGTFARLGLAEFAPEVL